MAVDTYDELTTTADYMLAGNHDVLGNMTDTDVIEMNQTIAKLRLKSDLIRFNGIDTADESNLIDTITSNHTDYLQRLLSYLQLSLYYQENNDGDGSQSFNRWQMYLKAYRDERNMMSNLLITESNIVTSHRISLG